MSNFFSFLILGLGMYLALFLFWKFTRDDYEDSDVFTLWAIALTGGILGFSIVNYISRSDALLVGITIAVLFGTLRARKLKMKLFEILEASVPSIFLFLLFVLLSWSVSGITLGIIADFLLTVLTLALFSFLKSHYRRFLWYPSGKMGFASLATVAIYFIARAIVAITLGRVLSFDLVLFSATNTLTFGLLIGAASLTLLYIQSGRQDLARFLRNNEKRQHN